MITTTFERRDEIRIRQEHSVEANGVKVTDVLELSISRADRLIRQKEAEVKEQVRNYPSRFQTEVKQMIQRMKDVDLGQELSDFVPIDKWTKEFRDMKKTEFYDERAILMDAFCKGKIQRKPYFDWTEDDIQERYQFILTNEGRPYAAEFMAEVEEECHIPDFEAEAKKELGYRLELYILATGGSLPPHTTITPLPGTFRVAPVHNPLGWNGTSFDQAGYFLTQVGEWSHVPIRVAVLSFSPTTRDATETLWETMVHQLSLENAPAHFITQDLEAGLEAKRLIARQKPLREHEMPDFLVYKTRMDHTTGRIRCIKEHEDQDWLDLVEFVTQLDHLVEHCGALPFLSEEEQEAYMKRREYVKKVLSQVERDSGTVTATRIRKRDASD